MVTEGQTYSLRIYLCFMGIVFRQSVKTSIVIFTGALLGAFSLYLGAKYIPKQQLGFFRNSLPEQAMLLSQIILFGLHNTLIVYVHKYDLYDQRRRTLIGVNLLVPALLLLLLLPAYFFFKADVVSLFQEYDQPLISKFYLWLPVLTILMVYMVLLEQYLISQLQVARATFMREVILRILTIGLIVLFAVGLIGYNALLPISVLVYFIPVLGLLVFASRTDGFRPSLAWRSFSKSESKELASFTWYHFLLTISINLLNKLDIILLGMWSSLSAAAIYGIAVYIVSFLQIPYRAMLNASFAILTQAYHQGDMRKVNDVFIRTSQNILVATVGLVVLICCNLDNAVALLPEGYEPVALIVLIISAGKLADIAAGMNEQILSISKYYRFTFYSSLGTLAVLAGLCFLLIPRYSFYGAAVATSASLIVYAALKLAYIMFRFRLQPFSSKTWLIFVSGAMAALVGFVIPFILNPVIDAAFRSLLILTVYVVALVVLKPSADFNNYIQTVRKNHRLF